MIYKLRQPQSFSEIGKKPNQEDYLWPLQAEASAQHRIFIVCDGVGGSEKGEVASQTAATALGTYLTTHWPADGVVTKEVFNKALAHAYKALDDADPVVDENSRMGTTMTCVVFHTDGVLLAHIGDSRIYHVRPALAGSEEHPSGIMHQTEDHSLVNDLLRVGEITEEEAANFPHKNVITRAMQPHLERPYRADIVNLTHIEAGDYFFLCTDGVLEQLTNEQLGSILATEDLDDAGKLEAIKGVCNHRTRDNYTCTLIAVDEMGKGRTTCPCPVNDDEELPDADIEDVVEEDDDETMAENAVEEGDEVKASYDEEEEDDDDDDDPESRKSRLCRSLRKAWRKTKAFTLKYWTIVATRVKATKLCQRLMKTNRWHWILGIIAFLSVYDLTLLFFGDTSYSIIYPTPKPTDSVATQEQESLIEPEVEEYEAPKPVLKEDKKTDAANAAAPAAEEVAPVVEEEAMPTSVNAEPAAAPTPAAPAAPKIEKPAIQAPTAPTE